MIVDLKTALEEKKRYQVSPGEHAIATGDVVLTTLLGSCVAACLYDPVNRIVGMNHFMLASRKYIPENRPFLSEAGRYGVNAMELLINGMLAKGAQVENLQAKAFGGANVLPALNRLHSQGSVGEINIRFLRNFLQRENIPLKSSNLGGTQGMLIHFFSADYSVYVKPVGKGLSSNIAVKEQRFADKALEKRERKAPEVELWYPRR
ncbi:chemotaxis protein CheD [Malonomonas rubra DSM 5091]|uniref:Probable chemoreceptor glutamine deamidase CheD n=1 Tax=Malonomonas rubra DSM 5091 TaxID=1122189 RepID=A0A1M6N3T8_MALRU|nr:chemotaxis protein CheD [Malonomonas rubra DSM 5091]